MKLTFLHAAGTMALASPALSQSLQDPYGFIFGGATFEGNSDYDGIIGGASNSVETDYDSGYQFGVGATLALNIRSEIELTFSE